MASELQVSRYLSPGEADGVGPVRGARSGQITVFSPNRAGFDEFIETGKCPPGIFSASGLSASSAPCGPIGGS